MSASWPSFWEHIPEADRSALREVIAQLLKTGVVLGNSGRDLQLFRLAQDYQKEIADYLSVLSLELFLDPSEPIFQARPIPGECALTAKFSKDETLVILTLWRMDDETRMESITDKVIVTANDLHTRLRLYFEKIEPPTPTHLDRILVRLRQRKLIQYRKNEDRFGDSDIEILPTLSRTIPFENAEAWQQYANIFHEPAANTEPLTAPPPV
jgi:hypothetical protein